MAKYGIYGYTSHLYKNESLQMMSGDLIVNIAVILIIFTAWWITYRTVINEIELVENQSVKLQNVSWDLNDE